MSHLLTNDPPFDKGIQGVFGVLHGLVCEANDGSKVVTLDRLHVVCVPRLHVALHNDVQHFAHFVGL